MASAFEAKILICVECGQEFVFTAGAQEYFAEKGYTEDPKRCKHCYMNHKRDKRHNDHENAHSASSNQKQSGRTNGKRFGDMPDNFGNSKEYSGNNVGNRRE